MKRAKIFAAVIYGMLVMGTVAFVNNPNLKFEPDLKLEVQPLQAKATIAPDDARETALRVIPGTIQNQEVETEHGQLIYSFEIAPQPRPAAFGTNSIMEVNVSATDGRILNVHREHSDKNAQHRADAELGSPAFDLL